ncbi:Fc.00g107100.m01.CDS01 [Cosmosporella sp. VM-42]
MGRKFVKYKADVVRRQEIVIEEFHIELSKSRVEVLSGEESLRHFYGSLPGDLDDSKETAGGLDVSPYGIEHEGLSYPASRNLRKTDKKNSFFKPITHGQAHLTQFNIVDRFGQVVCAKDPRPGQRTKSFYPRIGSTLLCEPQQGINGDGPPYSCRRAGCLAWLLISFHSGSTHVYDAHCSFIGEAFLPSGPNRPANWQSLVSSGEALDIPPHMLPKEYEARFKTQLESMTAPEDHDSRPESLPMSLEDLLVSMSHAPFLIGLWGTIFTAQEHIQSPPQQSSQFPSALVGRPLTLARLGLGIELATAPMRIQAYADYDEEYPSEGDLEAASREGKADDDPSETTGEEELARYQFSVKLGDMLGQQDSLVAYLSPPKSDTESAAWSIVADYTERDDDQSSTSWPYIQHSTNAPAITVSPSYPRLLPLPAVPVKDLDILAKVANYQIRKDEPLHSSTLTVLIDPFLPVNVRSGILPVATAQLSRAVVEHDLRKLGVWLRAGLSLIGARGAGPVSSEAGNGRTRAISENPRVPEGMRVPVHTPSTTATGAEWQWVQPVVETPMSSGQDEMEPGLESMATLSELVEYIHLEVMEPLKTGFDSVVAAEDVEAKGEEVEMAVALDGYLLLKS